MPIKIHGKINKYNLPAIRTIVPEDNLWGERTEWQIYNYPQIVLNILNKEKTLLYESLVSIISEHGIETTPGLVMRAVSYLSSHNKVTIKRGNKTRVTLI